MRLTKVTIKNNMSVIQRTIEYRYDHDNLLLRRIETPYSGGTPGTATTNIFVHDGNQVVLAFEKVGSGDPELTNRYTWGPGWDHLISDEQVTSLGTAGQTHWALQNQINSVVDVVTYDAAQDETTIAKHRQFDSFGNITFDSAPGITIAFAYTGKYLDTTTGLQNNINRWYASWLGKWISEDPIGFAGGDENLGRYVGNAVLTNIDSNGLAPTAATLQWSDFQEVERPPPGVLKYATTLFRFEFAAFSTHPLTVTSVMGHGGCFDVLVTLKSDDITYSAIFLPSSWVLEGSQTAALLEHERLHLQIAEYTADLATVYARSIHADGVGSSCDYQEARSMATNHAVQTLRGRYLEILDHYMSLTCAFTVVMMKRLGMEAMKLGNSTGSDHGVITFLDSVRSDEISDEVTHVHCLDSDSFVHLCLPPFAWQWCQ